MGFTPGNTDACTFGNSVSAYSERSGNPDLQPITADVWNAGIVWAPMATLSISADYYNWKIKNEVDTASTDQLLLAEYYCRNGLPNGSSATCQNAADWIVRDNAGNLKELYTPKMNVARQNLQAVTVGVKYLQDIGRFGALQFSGNYTNMLKREVQAQPGETFQDPLGNPKAMWNYDSFAKVRSDVSVAWSLDKFTTTLYANYIGHTPDYLAGLNGYGYVHKASGQAAGKWGSYTTYNLSANYRAQDDLTFSLMVNNVFNKMPDNQAHSYQGTSGTPFNNYLYNVYGRAVYVQAKYDFGK
ncbi:MAG: Vitamin B12 transporter BtuB [Stenotrophomonas maltophilia]|uniref:Vitamin B12 transporter BtuB n=1 Tax=Stenotrophomonas maltophilia TaxID=40324 RepID=A0A7V8FHL5_STEMA|nr:MAG: Vitamin B12 transporter BtuB [Stenotrophomonas maltophilia]